MVDKEYCMSSFLMYRALADEEKCFKENWEPNFFHADFPKISVYNSIDLEEAIQKQMRKWTEDGKAALALSGGIDSAILAKYMPKGSKAYTFQCVAPGVEVTNEVPQAKKYADECGLEHEIIEIDWDDMEKYAPILMKHKKLPIHSIEVQIYKAALKAKQDGFERLLFGETSDLNYGGLSGLMSKDWTYGEFVDRYTYIMPYHVLKDYQVILEPYNHFENNGYIDVHEFCRSFVLGKSMGSYVNACTCAGIGMETPYVHTRLGRALDYAKIRAGENKYIVREVFQRVYPDFDIPEKLSMPRPTNEWLKEWCGPKRPEFWEHCTDHMTGDQKWLVWALERFLNLLDEEEA